MKVVLKMILKNIGNKKARTFLILFSLILSTAVFFSSISISDSILKTVVGSVTKVVGTSDITILPTDKSESLYVPDKFSQNSKEKIDFTVGEFDVKGILKPNSDEETIINMKGVIIDELNKVNPINIIKSQKNSTFSGNSIIIGEDISKKYNYNINDEITLKIGEQDHKFTVWGIASTSGVFSKANSITSFVVPKDTITKISSAEGKDNVLYIKLKDTSSKKEVLKLLQDDYKNYEVKATFNQDKLESQLSDISSIFLLLSGIVFFMSIFIIYSSFKIITIERIPMIGTLRSIGATKVTTNIIVLGEALVYGVFGGIIGCFAGIGLLRILSEFMSDIANTSPGLELNTTIQFSFEQLLIAFVVSIILSIISSIIPILKISKSSIKDIILNAANEPKKNKFFVLVISIMLLIGSYFVTIPSYGPDNNLFIGIAILLLLISMVLLIPFIVQGFVKIFEKINSLIFGNIGALAAKNLRENKNIINNIIMLAISISVLLAINTSGYNTILASLNSYSNSNFDIRIAVKNIDEKFLDKLEKYDGVQDVYVDYEFSDIKIANSDNVIGTIKGINKNKFLDYWNMDSNGEFKELINKLGDEHNIIITNSLKVSLDVKEGDYIKIKTETGEKEYKVIGFFKAFMNDNDYAITSDSIIKSDMNDTESSIYYLKTNKTPEELSKLIKKDYKEATMKIYTKGQLEEIEIEDNKNTITLMRAFCIMAMVIGFFGVVNNLVLSFIQRRKSLAMFRSVGMSKKQIVGMTFLEAFTGSVIGGITGVFGGIGMIGLLSKLDNSKMNIQFEYLILYIIVGIIVMVIASIIPVRKLIKLNLVESLKTE